MSHLIYQALLDTAVKMEATAKRLRYQANQYKNQPAWPQQMSMVVADITPDDTITGIMLKLGCSATTAKMALAQARTKEADKGRQKRNDLIVRLAARGWTNAQIAARVKLHPTTISKVIQAR